MRSQGQQRGWRVAAAALGSMIALGGVGVRAENLRVPGEFATIQAAVDVAQDGDRVIVADGVYSGAGNVDVDFGGKAIEVRSARGADGCIIDCNASNADPHRGFVFQSGETSASVVDGFTIINGATESGAVDDRFNGAGILVTNASSPTIRNMVISGAHAGCWGGAICCSHGSSPMIVNCTLIDNVSDDDGGALFAWNGSRPTVINAVIAGNSARVTGGGMSIFDSGATIINSTVIGNSAPWGAGILDGSSQAVIVNSIIRGNTGNQQIWGQPDITYSNLEGGGNSGAGNIDAEPLFVDAARGDFRLRAHSPGIDAGDSRAVPGEGCLDLAGLPRFVDDRKTADTGAGKPPMVDMGAYEYPGPRPMKRR